jgi:hypothetical protein
MPTLSFVPWSRRRRFPFLTIALTKPRGQIWSKRLMRRKLSSERLSNTSCVLVTNNPNCGLSNNLAEHIMYVKTTIIRYLPLDIFGRKKKISGNESYMDTLEGLEV